jgi:hypothetical protein
VVGIDQIIGGVSKEGMALVRPRPLRCRVGPRDEFRRHRRRRAESGIVQRREILARGSTGPVLDLLRLPFIARNRALLVPVNALDLATPRTVSKLLCKEIHRR